MTLQTIVVLVLVAGAVAFLASRYLRMFRRKGGGGCGGCGCSSAKKTDAASTPAAPLQELTMRRSKSS
jgi:hypothetical protein